jgi:hypothetical protein
VLFGSDAAVVFAFARHEARWQSAQATAIVQGMPHALVSIHCVCIVVVQRNADP